MYIYRKDESLTPSSISPLYIGAGTKDIRQGCLASRRDSSFKEDE